MQMATGSYVGDGTVGRRIVSGLSGNVESLDITGDGGIYSGEKYASMPPTLITDYAGNPWDTAAGDLVLFDGADLIVSSGTPSPNPSANQAGLTFYWKIITR